MEKTIELSGQCPGRLSFDYLAVINYAMVLNEDHAVSRCELKNESHQIWRDICVSIQGDMIEPCQLRLAELRPMASISFPDANLMPVASKLMALTEAVQTSFLIRVEVGNVSVAQQTFPLTLMAFDQWHGDAVRPELIASFVTPNHPVLSPVSLRASQYLEQFSGNGDLDQYQSRDDDRIYQQVRSMYCSLLEEQLAYHACPASFEESGQRIRLVDKVLGDKLGNCLDVSLLLCSCLESIGIRTVLILYRDHAMMGAWLHPESSVPMVGYDDSELMDCISVPQPEFVVLQAVGLTQGTSFEEAVRQGEEYMASHRRSFTCFVDVWQARLNHVRPLPQSVLSTRGWKVTEMPDYDALFEQMAEQNPYEIHGRASAEKMKNKQLLWERKLLDLSLRNNLLNIRSGKHIIPLPQMPIDEILRRLENEELGSLLEEKDNFSTRKELYRAARISLEENGANSLFLSIGTLCWSEEDSRRQHFAPVMFLPVEMVRHSAQKYVIRPRDEEPLMNITLLEMMRQVFELEVPELSPIPVDEQERVDWRKVFASLNTTLDEVNEKRPAEQRWQIVEECMVGIFSFSKFVMWNDIHSNPEVIESHPLLRSLMEGRLDPQLCSQQGLCDARSLDLSMLPHDCALPVDVDSSQLEAVVNSGRGNSFLLYGPPGTGKSQTITNMIANALYHDKRVLFVAEKKAALEVVQERLRRIGLEPFCLELHSNKVDKKTFLAQMKMALNVERKASAHDYQTKSEELFRHRQELIAYVEALHQKRADGISLYEAINRYLSIEGEAMPMRGNAMQTTSLSQVESMCRELCKLDKVQEIIGCHPGAHPLFGLSPRENTADNQRQIQTLLQQLPLAVEAAQRKEKGWLNRLLFHRSALEILQRNEAWRALDRVAHVDPRLLADLPQLKVRSEQWLENLDKLRLWYYFSSLDLSLQAFHLPFVLEYYEQGRSGQSTADALMKGYLRRFAMDLIDTDPTLRTFNGLLFEEVIERYRALTQEFQQLTREELVCRLSQRMPRAESAQGAIAQELTFLNKRIAGNGRAYTVRRMLDETQHILPTLCPCMLMSPLSVSQYLAMKPGQFDLVIFDEASQMPTSESVATIARGVTTVVVGDPKQMPPTSFFAAQSTNENDAEVDDLESILDDCISLSLPSHYLTWHYRSKHESLIAFSNTHYYDGRLITFPSVDDQERKVTLVPVKGVYDFGKTRSNKTEAQAVVGGVLDLLEQQLVSGEFRSIGIVAFSKVQSSLIEDLLIDALAKHPQLEALANQGDEPIFVKNLENVQGDERDIILFSIGYGPDKSGRVSMNFGPLNQQGGERRLNVAVSRARYAMTVYSSLPSSMIDLERTTALGVAGLKRFLEYAETGHLPRLSTQTVATSVDPIIEQMAEQWRRKGYEVHTQVGRSRFKIDLALVDPEHPERYVKAFITDGTSYYDTPTARDREIVQPAVLQSLGWDLGHSWTADAVNA